MRDAAAADDLTQETLLAALRGQPRDPARLRPWLAGIARNLARREQRQRRLRGDTEADRALEAYKQQTSLQTKTRTRPAAVHSGLTRAHGALRSKLESEGGKQEWLATVGLLLLPVSGMKAATAATSAAATFTVKTSWLTKWGLGAGLSACLTIAMIVTAISLQNSRGGNPTSDEENISAPPTVSEPTQPALPFVPTENQRTAVASSHSTPPPDATARENDEPPSELAEEEITATMTASQAQFTGRYLDKDGQPVAQRELLMFQGVDGRPEFWRPSTMKRLVSQATTDASGAFSFPSVGVGHFVVGPRPAAPNATGWLTPIEITVDAPIVQADIQALGDHWIEGRIELDGEWNAAQVELTAFRSDVIVQAVTTCDYDGSFRFGPLAPGSYTVSSIGETVIPWAVPATAVEAKQASEPSLVLAATTARSVSGKIQFPPGAENDPKEGMIRIIRSTPSDDSEDVRWAAQVPVGPDGAYAVKGIQTGTYLISYESQDGRHVSLNLLSTPDTDQHSIDEDHELAAALKSDAMREAPREIAIARPAFVAWVQPGPLASQSEVAVTYRLKKTQHVNLGQAFPPFRYPIGPSGSVRVMVPIKGSRIELRGTSDNTLERWHSAGTKRGEVRLFKP